jgi:hypothetical protein
MTPSHKTALGWVGAVLACSIAVLLAWLAPAGTHAPAGDHVAACRYVTGPGRAFCTGANRTAMRHAVGVPGLLAAAAVEALAGVSALWAAGRRAR